MGKFKIEMGDITTYAVDGIVNAAFSVAEVWTVRSTAQRDRNCWRNARH